MRRRLSVLLLAIAIMALWGVAYQRLSAMSSAFFRVSGPGLRGLALYLHGDWAAAARAYRDGLQAWRRIEYADDPSGAFALTAGDLSGAERRARTTLRLLPAALGPRTTLGEIALDRKQYAVALRHFQEVLDRDPDNVDALLLSAIARARQSDAGGAIASLSRGLRLGSAGSRATLMFRVLELAGDLAPRQGSARSLCLLAHLHRYLRIFDEAHGEMAVAYATQAIAAGDRPADAYMALGIVHDKRGRYREALAAFERAVTVDPQHAEAYRWGALEAQRLQEPMRQYRMIRAAFEAAPDDPFYLDPLEDVLLRKFGDARTMLVLMQRAVAIDPGNASAHERLARAAQVLGEREQAAQHGKRAVDLRRQRKDT
ncbi:MAG TPA: tetratricopeptide repeat protein [Methylomirabilota bacterium]|nr:tetratricopeptide repeat protein [Methylomirabilota bacterium]